MEKENIRLVKYLSTAGTASRRAAGELVKNGHVSVNGTVVYEPGYQVQPGDKVTFDGKEVAPVERKVYVMLNKPRGYTCSNKDDHAEHLALELIGLAGDYRLFSAGRLDRDSEGLIIFSNDGDFTARLTHPRHEILKTYVVKASCRLTPEAMDNMRSGITDDGEVLKVRSIEHLGNTDYRIVLNEGKKREIRRLLTASGAKTLRLRRIRIGNLRLGDLPVGQWRELDTEEIKKVLENE